MATQIRSFIWGMIIGMWIVLLAEAVGLREHYDHSATQILDDLIDEWTLLREPEDTVRIAQLRPSGPIEFRVGFIPDTVYTLAEIVQQQYRVPKGVVIAQWALESRFGLSDLGAKNFLGHTYAALRPFVDSLRWVLRREKIMDSTGSIVGGPAVRFAHYRSLAECFDAHGRYLSGSARYRSAFLTTSPEAFARAIAKAGYATDPEYALKLITIMRRHNL